MNVHIEVAKCTCLYYSDLKEAYLVYTTDADTREVRYVHIFERVPFLFGFGKKHFFGLLRQQYHPFRVHCWLSYRDGHCPSLDSMSFLFRSIFGGSWSILDPPRPFYYSLVAIVRRQPPAGPVGTRSKRPGGGVTPATLHRWKKPNNSRTPLGTRPVFHSLLYSNPS